MASVPLLQEHADESPHPVSTPLVARGHEDWDAGTGFDPPPALSTPLLSPAREGREGGDTGTTTDAPPDEHDDHSDVLYGMYDRQESYSQHSPGGDTATRRATSAEDESNNGISPRAELSMNLDPRLSVGSHRYLQKAHTNSLHEIEVTTERHVNFEFWSLIFAMAMLSSALSFSVDQATAHMAAWRAMVVEAVGHNPTCVAIAFNTLLAVLARYVVRCCPEAEGSGLPEVKTMLFGHKMMHWFTLKALAVKSFGLTAVVSAGMPIGKEGPFVHLAACIVANLSWKQFERASGNCGAVSYLLLAAVAVGVGTTFSAPLGGVIFALELMLPQVYDMTAYLGCFVASVAGAIVYTTLKTTMAGGRTLEALLSTDVLPGEGAVSSWPMCKLGVEMLLGAICGLLGASFVKLHSNTAGMMKRWRLRGQPAASAASPRSERAARVGASYQLELDRSLSTWRIGNRSDRWAVDTHQLATARMNRQAALPMRRASTLTLIHHCWQKVVWRDIFNVAAAAAINTWLLCQFPVLGLQTQPGLLSTLFSKTLEVEGADWVIPSMGPDLTMLLFLATKWVTSIVCLALPTPTGIVAPCMVIGALIGRVFYQLLPEAIVDFLLSPEFGGAATDEDRAAFAARLAITGAACFTAAVARAFSMAITVFEVLALPNSVLSLSCSSLVAIFVANEIGPGFFDQILLNKNLAGVTAIASQRKAMMPVSVMMRRINTYSDCLSHRCTISEMEWVLQHDSHNATYIPVVHRMKGGGEVQLVGSMSRRAVQAAIELNKGLGGPSLLVDFMDPAQWRDESGPHVNRMPLHVSPNTTVKDVFLLFKVSPEEPLVYVTHKGRLLGLVNRQDLLGQIN